MSDRYRLAWLSARRRANRAWLNYHAAENALLHSGSTPAVAIGSGLADEDEHWTCGGCGHEGVGPDMAEWYEHTKVCPWQRPDNAESEPCPYCQAPYPQPCYPGCASDSE